MQKKMESHSKMKSDFSKIKDRRKGKKRAPKDPPYKVPSWFSKLKPGSHGNTPSQKKAWKVVSDYVRERDWKKYHGFCADGCGTRIEDWRNGDCGHYLAWSVCHGLFKFCLENLVLQASNCNRRSDGVIGHGLGEELKRRHGDNHLEWIEMENEKYRGKKIEEWELVEMVARLRPDLATE